MCEQHELDVKNRFKKVEAATEAIDFYIRNPKIFKILIQVLKWISIAAAILIAYAIGHSEIIEKLL